jgi:2-polyprenyl-6-methoxyphenol hydroxylase-like FAD-dependent oxidoreductase
MSGCTTVSKTYGGGQQVAMADEPQDTVGRQHPITGAAGSHQRGREGHLLLLTSEARRVCGWLVGAPGLADPFNQFNFFLAADWTVCRLPPSLPRPGDQRIAALKTADDVRDLFKDVFPSFLPAVREVDFERFAAKSDCSLPTFSYAGPVLHHGSSTVLVGDAIHTVKPYFGQGVNSAFEDVKVSRRCSSDHQLQACPRAEMSPCSTWQIARGTP